MLERSLLTSPNTDDTDCAEAREPRVSEDRDRGLRRPAHPWKQRVSAFSVSRGCAPPPVAAGPASLIQIGSADGQMNESRRPDELP